MDRADRAGALRVARAAACVPVAQDPPSIDAEPALLLQVTSTGEVLIARRLDDPREALVVPTSTGVHTAILGYAGGLAAYRLTFDRRPLFELTNESLRACRTSYARHPSGGELFIRVESVPPVQPLPPPPDVWWRAGGDHWGRLDNPGLTFGGMQPLGELLLVSAPAQLITPVFIDPHRPQLPPRFCESVPVTNDAAAMIGVDDATMLIAGEMADPSLGIRRSFGRWQAVAA